MNTLAIFVLIASVLLCKSEVATVENLSPLAPLLSHQNGAAITDNEELLLRNLFDTIDDDGNSLLSEPEFKLYIESIFDYGSSFDVMDLNEDGKLAYNELVYSYKREIQFNSPLIDENVFPELSQIDEEFNEIAPGNNFNDETEAEYIANILISVMDDAGNNYLDRAQYIDFQIGSEWYHFVDYDANINEIDFDHFKSNFFDSVDFRMSQQIINTGINSPSVIDNYVTFASELGDAHENWEIILDEVDEAIIFQAHEFDDEWGLDDGNRRRLPLFLIPAAAIKAGGWILAKAIGVALAKGLAKTAVTAGINFGFMALANQCYDELDTVYELNSGLKYMKDLSVGDYVYDGNDYTKIYFIQTYDNEYTTNMLEILYGNPNEGNSITLTSHHLLYYADGNEPVISGDIKIGDLLYGNNDGNNYTVYDIKNVYNKHPINPITASGNLMVNNIKTSVFTRSAAEHKRLTECGKIFVWISDNLSQDVAANLVDFYWNIVYVKIIRQNYYIHQLFVLNETFATMIILSVPTLIIMILFRTSNPIKKLDDINVC